MCCRRFEAEGKPKVEAVRLRGARSLVRVSRDEKGPCIAGAVHVNKDDLDAGIGDLADMLAYPSGETDIAIPIIFDGDRFGKTPVDDRKKGDLWCLRPHGSTSFRAHNSRDTRTSFYRVHVAQGPPRLQTNEGNVCLLKQIISHHFWLSSHDSYAVAVPCYTRSDTFFPPLQRDYHCENDLRQGGECGRLTKYYFLYRTKVVDKSCFAKNGEQRGRRVLGSR